MELLRGRRESITALFITAEGLMNALSIYKGRSMTLRNWGLKRPFDMPSNLDAEWGKKDQAKCKSAVDARTRRS